MVFNKYNAEMVMAKMTFTASGENGDTLLVFRDFCKERGLVQSRVIAKLVEKFMGEYSEKMDGVQKTSDSTIGKQ